MEERFWSKVEKTDTCWIWTAAKINGYGVFWHSGKNMKAHRLSYEAAFSPIPIGLYVLHHCDVPSCVNPAHLFLGTQRDNIQDMDSKGRGRRGIFPGESAPAAKLTLD